MAIVRVTKKMAEKAIAKIDWKRIDAMTDEDIAAQVASNPDAAPLPFAERFRIPAASLRDWEQGRRLPDAATQAYLTVIERNPRAVETALADG